MALARDWKETSARSSCIRPDSNDAAECRAVVAVV
jgi:hypothetical protein